MRAECLPVDILPLNVADIAATDTAVSANEPFDNPERVAWIEEQIKLSRIGKVSDVMAAVTYLASEASSLVTGAALIIDWGWTAD